MKLFPLLCGLFLLAPLPTLAKKPAKPAKSLDLFTPYLGMTQFLPSHCLNLRERTLCARNEDLVIIEAELERRRYKADRFWLSIMERSTPTKPFKVREFLVSFSKEDGLQVLYENDIYDQFEQVYRRDEIPYESRLWLLNIMRALEPGYQFNLYY